MPLLFGFQPFDNGRGGSNNQLKSETENNSGFDPGKIETRKLMFILGACLGTHSLGISLTRKEAFIILSHNITLYLIRLAN